MARGFFFFLKLTINALKKKKKASWLLTSWYNVDSSTFQHSGRRNLLNVTQQNSLQFASLLYTVATKVASLVFHFSGRLIHNEGGKIGQQIHRREKAR